jgi:hypothetical protein
MSTDVSEEHIASVFRVEEIISARNLHASKQVARRIIPQKLILVITTAVKTSNPTKFNFDS